ncbi:UNVERIFIED_CONTAM: hypothetical protein K2H54_019586 [Gekko kuhli]
MNVHIHTTTGARYELSVPLEETVEGLKRRLSQRLKVPKERLALLHKESHLNSGKLQDLGVAEGSKLTLVPTVEAGLMSQASRPEQSVMQALESLTETQVNDFLSGRSPLTLALRVGDHMMFVQLQLAAQQNGGQVQHRHVIASRGEPASGGTATTPVPVASPAASNCRTFHGGSSGSPASGFARVPVVPTCQQSPASSPAAPSSSAQATPMYCNAAHPTPVTAGMFRSHGASAQAVGSSGIVSSCSEVDCTARSNGLPGTSPAQRSRKPGAVIESFVNHAPGVFSGTFSGTLHPNCQDSSGRPRRDIGTILQILNDLLSATRHYQGMPHSLTQLRCQTQCSLSSSPPLSPDLANSSTSEKLAAAANQPFHSGVPCPSQAGICKPSGREEEEEAEPPPLLSRMTRQGLHPGARPSADGVPSACGVDPALLHPTGPLCEEPEELGEWFLILPALHSPLTLGSCGTDPLVLCGCLHLAMGSAKVPDPGTLSLAVGLPRMWEEA